MGVLLVAAIGYCIIYTVMGIALLFCLVYGGIAFIILSLLQWVIGQLVKGVTGEKPGWLFSQASFILEILLIVVLTVGYANIPVHPARMDAEAVALICDTAEAATDTGEARISHRENIDRLVEELNAVQASHVFFTSRESLKKAQDKEVWKFYFYDSNGKFVKKIALDLGLIGVSSRLDGKFTWYDLKKQDREALERLIWDLDAAESRCRTEDDNAEALAALRGSFRYADGAYWFTVPEFQAKEWNVEISAFERKFTQTVVKSSGYVMRTGDETGTGHFLTEQTESHGWQTGQTYSFRLEDRTYESVSCTVTLDGSAFKFDFPTPDGKYLADRDAPVTYYIT